MRDRIDFRLLGALLKKNRRENTSSFRKGNFDAVGFVMRLLLAGAFIAIFVIFFGKFVDMYLGIKLNNVSDAEERLYELLTLVYGAVLLAMILSGISQINQALFSADDMRVIAALPIGANTLYLSKIILIYLGQLVVACFTVLPVNLTVAAHYAVPTAYYPLTALACVVLPLMSVAISSILALPYHALKVFLKDKFLLNFIVITVLTALLLFLYAYVLEAVKELLLGDDMKYFFNEKVMTGIALCAKYLYPANLISNILLGRELLVSSLVIAGWFLACMAVSLLMIRMILTRSLQSRISGSPNFVKKVKPLAKSRLPFNALLRKEFLMIFRTPGYMFSYFAIAVVMPLLVYFCMSVGSSLAVKLIAVDSNLELAIFLTMLFGMLANMFCSTNISRDGMLFYSLKAMPLNYKQVIFSKVLLCMIVTAFSQLFSATLLAATSYITVANAAFLFVVGMMFGFAQICVATRADFNHPHFSSESDGEIKESGNTVSTVLVIGIVLSFALGGALLLTKMYFSLRGLSEAYAYLTYVITAGIAILSVAGSVTFLLFGLKDRFYRFSGGGLH